MRHIGTTNVLANPHPLAVEEDDDLVLVQPTALLEQREASIREKLARLYPDGGALRISPLGAELRTLVEHTLPLARERDARATQRQRPSGCWCLGRGGKNRMYVNLPGTGDAVDDLPFVFNTYCECLDGARRRQEDDQLRSTAAAHRNTLHLESLWHGSGIPDHYATCTLATYPQTDRAQKLTMRGILNWQGKPTRWLYLHGQVGRGKTALACAIARQAILDGTQTLFRTVPELLSSLRGAMRDPTAPDPEAMIKALFEVDLLVLDDMGVEKVSDWTLEAMFRLIDARKNAAKRTIITSNLPLTAGPESLGRTRVETLGTRLNERIASRIDEMSDVVLVAGPNLRQAKTPDAAEALPW